MEQKFDAIIVGAGPAGCACGYKLAKSGLQVLVVERGRFAGAKNMWGGAFFGPVLNDLIPNFWESAPIERFVSRRKISFLSGERCLSVEFTTSKFNQPPYDGLILFRSKFDNWFAGEVQKAGAIVATGLEADDLLWDGNKVIGIQAGKDKLPADVVIACDGVNSVLARRAGIRPEIKPMQVKQGVKEVWLFSRQEIEQRFGISGEEGIAWEFIGTCTGGLPGGAFIYTNKESLSVGIVVQLEALIKEKITANELLENFKSHTVISKLLQGGKLVEYSAHLIPVMGINMMPRLCTDGFMVAGDAAAFVLGTGLILEGANFAIGSGIAAAETVLRAKSMGDFSASSLSYYQDLLNQNFVLRDLKTFQKAPHFLENRRIYNAYPEFVCELAEKIFSSDGKPRKKTFQLIKESMKNKVSVWNILTDLIKSKDAL